jgi:hypothetical protein
MEQPRYLYSELARTIGALKLCEQWLSRMTPGLQSYQKTETWIARHSAWINGLVRLMPSGSGINSGTKLELGLSHADKLVFSFRYHHMNEDGYYDEWTDHRAVVTPTFDGINVLITGKNRNDIRDYLHDTFYDALKSDVTLEWFQFNYEDIPAITSEWINSYTQQWSVSFPDGTSTTSNSLSAVRGVLVKWCNENIKTLVPQV